MVMPIGSKNKDNGESLLQEGFTCQRLVFLKYMNLTYLFCFVLLYRVHYVFSKESTFRVLKFVSENVSDKVRILRMC